MAGIGIDKSDALPWNHAKFEIQAAWRSLDRGNHVSRLHRDWLRHRVLGGQVGGDPIRF